MYMADKKCLKTNCKREQKSRGYCSNHYKKLLAHVEDKASGLTPDLQSEVFTSFWEDLETRGKALPVKMIRNPHDTDSLLEFISDDSKDAKAEYVEAMAEDFEEAEDEEDEE